VLGFLGIALPLSYALCTLPALAEYGVIPGRDLPQRIGIDLEEAASFGIVAVLFATVLYVTAVTEGRDGLRTLLRRMTRWRVHPGWWVLAVGVLPAATVALAVVLGDRARTPDAGTIAGEIGSLCYAFVAVNIWEEASWTAFLQTRLERRFRFLPAAALAALPFAAVHLPLRVITRESTTVASLLAAFGVLFVFAVFVRTLFATVGRGAANSVLLPAATHTFFNRSNNDDGVAADILVGDQRQSAALLVTVVLTVALAVLNRRRLRREYRRELDEREAQRA
jgi:membrane protease YdiL (CAAX protease family)